MKALKKEVKAKEPAAKAENLTMSGDANDKHVVYSKETQRVFYSISILMLVLASIVVSLILVPMLLFFNATSVYVTVLITGLVFGFIFTFLVLDLKQLEKRHHDILGVIVPLTAVLNIYIIVTLVKKVSDYFSVQVSHNPYIVSSFYLLGFSIPYLYFGMLDYVKARKKAEEMPK